MSRATRKRKENWWRFTPGDEVHMFGSPYEAAPKGDWDPDPISLAAWTTMGDVVTAALGVCYAVGSLSQRARWARSASDAYTTKRKTILSFLGDDRCPFRVVHTASPFNTSFTIEVAPVRVPFRWSHHDFEVVSNLWRACTNARDLQPAAGTDPRKVAAFYNDRTISLARQRLIDAIEAATPAIDAYTLLVHSFRGMKRLGAQR